MEMGELTQFSLAFFNVFGNLWSTIPAVRAGIL